MRNDSLNDNTTNTRKGLGATDRQLSAKAVVVPPECSISPAQLGCPETASFTFNYTGATTGATYLWTIIGTNTAGAQISGSSTSASVLIVPIGADFVAGGTFDLQLSVTKDGLTTTCSLTPAVTIGNVSVTAGASPTTINLFAANHSSQLTATASPGTNSDYSFSWAQDPASGGSLSSSTISNPVFTATGAGTYQFIVTATQTAAPHCVAKDTVYVDVLASAPNCNLTGPTETCAGTTGLVFDGGTIPANFTFHWAVNNGATITSAASDSSTITVTAGTSDFTVTLYMTPDNTDLTPINCPLPVTVHPIPVAPTTGGDVRCGSGTVHLTASGCDGGTLKWYDASSGGTLLHTGTSYDTSITADITLYVSCTSAYGCVGPRASVTGTIHDIPAAPTTGGDSRCGTGSVHLTASGCSGGTLNWYDASSDGNLLHSGSSYDTTISNTMTLYVSCTSVDGCIGPRASVTAEVMNCDINCTVTQGYYGSPGKSCDGTQKFNSAIDLIAYLLGVNSTPNPLIIGRAGRSVTMPATLAGAIKLNSVMPGGTTPTGPLSGDCVITDPCFDSYTTLQGRIGNVLLSQTIALSLNARMNGGQLAGFPVQSGWLTTMKRSGCGVNSTLVTCAQDPGSVASFQMNSTVVNYLTNNGANEATVQDLLELANDVLGGVFVPGQPGAHGITVPSYSAINSTEDAFNNAFDGCRSFVGYYECRKTCSNLGIGCPLPVTFDGNIDVNANGTSPIPPKVSAYPNPYNDKVTFTVESPVSGQATLEVYNMVGQRVGVLYNGYLKAGVSQTIDYNVPENNRGNLIYILKMNDRKATGKLIRPN